MAKRTAAKPTGLYAAFLKACGTWRDARRREAMPDGDVHLLVIVYRGADGILRAANHTAETYAAAEAMVLYFPAAFPSCRLVSALIVPV